MGDDRVGEVGQEESGEKTVVPKSVILIQYNPDLDPMILLWIMR